MKRRTWLLLGMLLAACYGARPQHSLGRVDGYGQIVRTLSWMEDRNVREATPKDVASLLGAEAQYLRRQPVQIFGVWTEDLAWTDVTGRFEIVFSRRRDASAPFSMFRVSGRFPTKAAGLEAVGAWLALLDPANVEARIDELRASPESYVEYELQKHAVPIRISLGITGTDGDWNAGVDVENIRTPGRNAVGTP